MKRKQLFILAIMMASALVMTACGADGANSGATGQSEVQSETGSSTEEGNTENEGTQVTTGEDSTVAKAGDLSKYADAVQIVLDDAGVTVNGEAAATSNENAVYVSSDIIYYEDKDSYESGNPYGEGDGADKHSAEEAAAHTVVNITQPGTYHVTGTLSAGQIFVKVGEEETDKVTLILNGVDITCEVAPAVLFYEVYECDEDASEETATKDVDTTNAGAKVILADDSVNNVTGSYVAKIYKDNDEKKKLYKFDGAFYSKASMEISGDEKGDGILNITAENEGLDSEMHLTIQSGNINIKSADDGINTNEDNISVCTVNGGNLNIQASLGKEGDGIDSNGWLVINGGTVTVSSNPTSPDAGIDSDMGIYIYGGTVISCGNMYDSVEADSTANVMVFQFTNGSKGNLVVKDSNDEEVVSFECTADYSTVVISSDTLEEGTYHVYNGETQLSHSGMMMGMGGERPQKPEREKPKGGKFAEGEIPQMPEGEMPAMPEGEIPQKPEDGMSENSEKSTDFNVEKGVNFFGGVAE